LTVGHPEAMEVTTMLKTRAFASQAGQAGGAQTLSQEPLPRADLELIRTTLCSAFEELLRPVLAELELIRATLEARRKPHYTVDEVAELTGRTPYTVRRWISEERIQATRIEGTGPKGRLLIAREEVDALIAAGLGAQVPDAAVGQ
jgi:excisionase family DNA binding protein